MLFGLVKAGASFCRLIRIVLRGLQNVDSFVDDMWIFSSSWEDHMTSLRQVWDRLRSAKVAAKHSNYMICDGSIECLGHSIEGQAMKPKEDKT